MSELIEVEDDGETRGDWGMWEREQRDAEGEVISC